MGPCHAIAATAATTASHGHPSHRLVIGPLHGSPWAHRSPGDRQDRPSSLKWRPKALKVSFSSTMPETERVVATLKRLLKAQGMTYRALATKLGLSEPAVKRMFSHQAFTLERLARIA